MITLLGRVIGVITTPIMQDLAQTCADFLAKNQQYIDLRESFQVDNVDVLCIKDTYIDGQYLYVAFKDYNGVMYYIRSVI